MHGYCVPCVFAIRNGLYRSRVAEMKVTCSTGVDHGGMRGMHPPTTEAGGWPVQSSPPTKEMSR